MSESETRQCFTSILADIESAANALGEDKPMRAAFLLGATREKLRVIVRSFPELADQLKQA